MARTFRERIVEEIAGKYKPLECYILINFTKLSAQAMSQARAELRRKGVKLNVQKNSLLKLALKKAEKPVNNSIFNGSIAVAYGGDDPITLCKSLTEWVNKNSKVIKIKGGFLQGKQISDNEIAKLSQIPSREVLLAQLATAVKSPIARIAFCIKSAFTKPCIAVSAYSKKLEEK